MRAQKMNAPITVTRFCGDMADNVVFMNQVCRGKAKAFEVMIYIRFRNLENN